MNASRLTGREPGRRIIDRPGHDVSGFALSPDERFIALNVNDEGYSALSIVDQSTGGEHPIGGIPRGVVSGLSWKGGELSFTLSTYCTADDIWRFSPESGTVVQLTRFGTEDAVVAAGIEPHLEHIESCDGVSIPCFVHSDGTGPLPGLVYVHGGPEGQSHPNFDPFVQFPAAQGVAVAVPNIRGSSGYGRKYLALDDGSQLRRIHRPGRLGSPSPDVGGRYRYRRPLGFPHLVAGSGALASSPAQRRMRRPWRVFGFLPGDISPARLSDRITAPLLVFHGANDSRVPPSESTRIAEVMLERGQDVELTVFTDEGHFTHGAENNRRLFSASWDLLRRAFAGQA